MGSDAPGVILIEDDPFSLCLLEPVWSEAMNFWMLRIEEGPHTGKIVGWTSLWQITDPHDDPEYRISVQSLGTNGAARYIEELKRFVFDSKLEAIDFSVRLQELHYAMMESWAEKKKPRKR